MADLEELRATAHPLRLRLLSLLTGAAMSAAEAARELGEQQANVSYHLRLLQKAGLIDVVETVRIRGGVAKRYRHTESSKPFDLDPAPAAGASDDSAGAREAFVAAMASELRRRAALHRPGVQVFTDAEVWVEEETWRQVVDLVGRASALLHRSAVAPRTPEATPVAMSAALFELGPA